MNSKFFCPICGNELKERYSIGDICTCCGNESEFDDDIEKPDIDYQEYFKILEEVMKLEENNEEVPKKLKEYLESTTYTKEEAWEILRNKWIKEGCKWKYNFRNEKPKNWNMKMVKKQLLNINIKL